MKLHFNPVTYEDLELLNRWQDEPHVKEVWASSGWTRSYETYIIRTSRDSEKQFMIELEEDSARSRTPIGYIQFYWASKAGDGWWEGYDDQTVGIDFYIGDPAYLGKGLGRKTIREFVEKLFSDPKFNRIIADPSPKNERIIHLLQQEGFKPQGQITTPVGPAELMSLTREQWQKLRRETGVQASPEK